MPKQGAAASRRPASPFGAGRQFQRASCAPPLLSAAVAELLGRSMIKTKINKDDMDNHADQLNPNNDAYWLGRGWDGRPGTFGKIVPHRETPC